MDIVHDLLPKQRTRHRVQKVTIDLYPTASELYDALDGLGIIERVKQVPQLGLIKVNSKLSKSRYDYIMLQLYFHQLIKKEVGGFLKYSYNNLVAQKEFPSESARIEGEVSIADIVQCLVLAYNIGHFYNTFTASRAAILLARDNKAFLETLKSSCSFARFGDLCDQVLDDNDYRRMHLLNTLVILDHCDPALRSVRLAKEIVAAYLDRGSLPQDSKLLYAFHLFGKIRNMAYVAYDLQVANTPFTVDISNKSALRLLFKEQLSEYNNGESANALVESIQEMLDRVVYNESSGVICHCHVSKRIYRYMLEESGVGWGDYFSNCFMDSASGFNKEYGRHKDYDSEGILKLTFGGDGKTQAEDLLAELDHTSNVRVGYYYRPKDEVALLVALRRSCKEKSKVAFKVLGVVIKHMRKMGLESSDDRYILVTKFFLQYLFGGKKVLIKPTIDDKKCVLCTRGRSSRVDELQRLLLFSSGDEDADHEVQAIIDKIKPDAKNDTCITVPGSTVVIGDEGKKLCEIDGVIIYPNRKEGQVTLVEAKNTHEKPFYGARCLRRTIMRRLKWNYDRHLVEVVGYDAYYTITVGEEAKVG